MAKANNKRSVTGASRQPTKGTPAATSLPRRHFSLAAAVLIACAVVAIYGQSLNAPLVFDDTESVVHNPSIVRLWPLVGTIEAPGPLNPPRDTCTSGRPLVNLSLAVNYHFGGLNPRGYHVVNMVFHALAALLLYGIVRRVLRLDFFAGRFARAADLVALCAALAWAAHPLATEAVEYITQRTELMMAFWYLMSVYASLRYWSATAAEATLDDCPLTLPSPARGEGTWIGSHPHTVWLALGMAACAAGMACKEVMASAPLVILLLERTLIAGSFRRSLKNSWPLYAGLVSGWLVLAALNYDAPRSVSAGFSAGVPAATWWMTQARVLLMYLKLAVWPWPQSIFYDVPYVDSLASGWPWVLPVAGLLAATAFLVARRSAVGFVLATMFLILAPTSLVPIPTEIAAERRMYLPLATLASLAVSTMFLGLERLINSVQTDRRGTSTKSTSRVAFVAISSTIVMTLAIASSNRLAVYRDTITLWQDTLASAPRSPLVHMNLGLELVGAGRPREAIEHYREALRLEPQRAATHQNNLGYALLQAGDLDQAMAEFEVALAVDPELAEAHNNLGMALVQAGRPRDAIPHFQESIRLKPDYAEGHITLGTALLAAGRPQDAIEQFQETIRDQPDSIKAYSFLAKTYSDLGDSSAAIAAAERALALAHAQDQAAEAAQIEAWINGYRRSLDR